MRSIKKGFTLVELLVVVIILGVLTSMGVPYYIKTVESSKAMDAVAVAHMVSAATQMMMLDNPSVPYNAGTLTNLCNAGACTTAGARSACDLVRCNYISRNNWDSLAFVIRSCNPDTGAGGGGCAVGRTAHAQRRSGTYSGWNYYFTTSGTCVHSPTSGSLQAPTCPSF